MELDYLQIEIVGKCENNCSLCLPKKFKTGREMSIGEAQMLARQISVFNANPKITFAGYGNPVEHSSFQGMVEVFDGISSELTLTCRVGDLDGIGIYLSRVNVSIDSTEDARKLLEHMHKGRGVRAVVPHIVLAADFADKGEDLFSAIDLLVKNISFFEKISVAKAVVLCDDPAHVKEVGRQNNNAKQAWEALRLYASRCCSYAKNKIVLWDDKPRMQNCAWRKGGLLINSRLQVLPCCNLPCVDPIADLHGIDLKSLLEFDSEPHNGYATRCGQCPNLGTVP